MLSSCDFLYNKIEWPGGDKICGVMFFDGEEFREVKTETFFLAPQRSYGYLYAHSKDKGDYDFRYTAQCLVNSTITTRFDMRLAFSIPEEQLKNGRFVYYGDEEDDWLRGHYFRKFLEGVSHPQEDYFYKIAFADIRFSEFNSIKSNEQYDVLEFRIDYKMEVLDTLDASHIIEGWAIPFSGRQAPVW